MARRRGNPVSDFIDTAGAWLGGTRNIQSPAVTRGRQAVQQTLGALDQATGGFGQAAVNDARRLASGSGYVPSQTIKTAAVNLGAAAAGYGAAKGVQAAIQSGRVVNPAAAVRNAVKGEKVVVHGTPYEVRGTQILPTNTSAGSQMAGQPVAFAHDPRAKGASKNLFRQAANYATNTPQKAEQLRNVRTDQYDFLSSQVNKTPDNNLGSIVIGSAKKTDVKKFSDVLSRNKDPENFFIANPDTQKYVYSENPINIRSVVKPTQPKTGGPEKFDPKVLQRELRKQGVSLRSPSIAEQARDAKNAAMQKVEAIKRARRRKSEPIW